MNDTGRMYWASGAAGTMQSHFCRACAFPVAVIGMLCVLGCAPRTSMKALISMIGPQEAYFKETVVPAFTDKNRVQVSVTTCQNMDSIQYALDANKGQIGLVKIPFEKGWSLVRNDRLMPLNNFLTPEEIREFDGTFMLTSLAKSGESVYFIPRKFETRLMVYLKSKVQDACAVWRKHLKDISAELKKYNGYGLPATYLLEEDPNEWDYYDVFVAGWIWAHTAYGGMLGPKIAHRGRRYSGTWHRLVDRVFQCNGDSAQVVTMQGDAVTDAFHWEAVYAASGVYNEKMWKESWSGAGIWKGIADGEVYLSFMTQLDCFFIHGTGTDELKGFCSNPDDMAVAMMPTGCSVELDGRGEPLRIGSKAITTGGWWWGIPRDAPDPRAAYQLARHITSMENQVQECNRFGMIPVRKDVLSDMQMLFGGQWISEIYTVSFKQLMQNKVTMVPSHPRFDEIGTVYLDAWFDIVVDRHWSGDGVVPSRDFIKNRIADKFYPVVANLR